MPHAEDDSRSDMPRGEQGAAGATPRLVHIGLLLAADDTLRRPAVPYEAARDRLHSALAAQFPRFQWRVTIRQRRRFSPHGAVDPVALLEYGVQEKLAQRWDYALVLVPNELEFRDRPTTWGAPSSALEVAVLSTDRISSADRYGDEVAAMALHLLGHLWGEEHAAAGPMRPADHPEDLHVVRFPADQEARIVDRLDDVADARVEEQSVSKRAVSFYWRTFTADPRAIITDVRGYAPWALPFRLGRLTAGALSFIVILLLAAEPWEVGVHASAAFLAGGAVLAIAAAVSFLFVGQNLRMMAGGTEWHEQLARTQIVIFLSLLVGITSLWVVLAVTTLLCGLAMPDAVLARWLPARPDFAALCRHATFMATLGTFGAALGGSLEDEGNFKAKFLFDQDP